MISHCKVVLAQQDAANIRPARPAGGPVRLTGLPAEVSAFETEADVFHFFGVCAGRFLRSLAVGETAATFQDGVVGAPDFVEERHWRCHSGCASVASS